MTKRSLWSFGLVAAAAAAAVLVSCTADGGTIYATIEKVTATVDASLPNTLNVAALTKSASGTYWVAAGTLYKGTLASGTVTWTPADTKDASRVYNPSAGALANSFAYEPGTSTWWAGFVSAGADLGVYRAAGPDPTSWATAAALSGKQAVLIKAVGSNNLFVVSATLSGSPSAYVYGLDYSSDGSTFTTLLSGQSSPINGVATDGLGTWFVSTPTAVYSDVAANGTYGTTELTAATADGAITGLFGDAVNHRVYALTTKGGIYFRTGASAWTQAVAPTVGTATVSALSMAGPVDSSNLYLVGTDGYGFYSFAASSVGTATSPWARPTDTTTTTVGLYTASVSQVLDDAGTILMGTHGLGVWRATFDTSSGAISSAWTHE